VGCILNYVKRSFQFKNILESERETNYVRYKLVKVGIVDKLSAI
jgi:hypothetical protein